MDAPPMLDGLSVVLACRDADADIAEAVLRAGAAAAAVAWEHEVIVVDDASTDDTARVVATLVELDRHVRLIVHSGIRGRGAALRSGVRAARQPWVLLGGADLRLEPCELADLAALATPVDLVVGRRAGDAGRRHLPRRLRGPGGAAGLGPVLARRAVLGDWPLDSGDTVVGRARASGARTREVALPAGVARR